MEEKSRGARIRIAGNTENPALLALRAKGYRVWLEYTKTGTPTNPAYELDYQAEIEGGYFSATTPVELLGLVAMWETRGDNWKATPAECAVIQAEIEDRAKTYDSEGNELQDE